MKLLTVDTAGRRCCLCLSEEDRPVYEVNMDNGLTHSQTLLPAVDAALCSVGWKMEDLDGFGCVCGPGSFTGVRIGVATVRAMAQATGKKAAPLCALEVLAGEREGWVAALMDARCGQVYGALFKDGCCVVSPVAEKTEDFLKRLPEGEPICLVGDGAVAYGDGIRAQLSDRAIFPTDGAWAPRGACAAHLAYLAHQRGETVDFDRLMPVYLRAPQAEREADAREARLREAQK